MKIIEGINPNCSELIIRLPKEMPAGQMFKKLHKAGFDNNCFENGSVEIRHGYEDDDAPIIMGSQHCNPEIYPLLYAISKEFDAPVEGYDGGSVTEYDDWVEQGRPDPKEFTYE